MYLQLLLALLDDHLAGLHRVLAVGRVELEVRASLEERFLGGSALAESLRHPLFAITFALSAPLDGHIDGSKVVFELQIDRALCGRKDDLLDFLAPGNLVDLGYVL